MAYGIVSGEQYPIGFVLKQGTTVYTPDNIQQVRAKLGKFSASYPDGNLVYRNGVWQFPLTQEMSYQLKNGKADFQVQGKTSGGNIFSTKIAQIAVDPTIFGGVW